MFTFEAVKKARLISTPENNLLISWLYGFKPTINCVLEIGVQTGGSLAGWQLILEPDGLMIGVDINLCVPFQGWLGEMEKTIERFKGDKRIRFILADSREPKTFIEVKKILGNRLVDFLYIDGEHSGDGVRKDFQIYYPLVSEGGIIAFHDATKNILMRPVIEEISCVNELRGNLKFEHVCRFDSREGQCGVLAMVKKTLQME